MKLARDFAAASIAPTTVGAYRSALADSAAWCAERHNAPMPETVAACLASLVDRRLTVATATQRSGAIRWAREAADQEGAGHDVVVLPGSERATCSARALRDWLEAAGIVEDRVFRSVDRHGLGETTHRIFAPPTSVSLPVSRGV